MAHTITLSDEDYAALAAVAERTGETIEQLVHQAIDIRFQVQTPSQEGSYQYPTGEPDSAEDEAEDEELAKRIGSGKPWLSEMIIEDRGPR